MAVLIKTHLTTIVAFHKEVQGTTIFTHKLRQQFL